MRLIFCPRRRRILPTRLTFLWDYIHKSSDMRTVLILLSMILSIQAGALRVSIQNVFGDHPLALNSLKYQGAEDFSVNRFSYLLSEFALQKKDDQTWIALPDQFAYLDAVKRRTHFTLTDIPAGDYSAIRFSLGVPRDVNHSDTSVYSPKHPLNPNLNQLHWDWAGGYIFLAIEGRYRSKTKDLKGYVYHLANDVNLSRTQLSIPFQIEKNTHIELALDIKKLLGSPRPLSFEKDGNSTHSHPGDPIASALIANFQSSLSVAGVNYPADEIPQQSVKPLYLPEMYTPYLFKMSRRFPQPILPRDNPLLTERVDLGKKLFFDPILSVDRSISCSSCHTPEQAFSDARPLSVGFQGRSTPRHSMPLFNLAWKSSFFWDGRATSLREQVLQPIQDHREMASNLDEVVTRLNTDQDYSTSFEKAFGSGAITSEKLALALENYLLSLTSYESKFDSALSGEAKLTEKEQRGMELFFTEYEPRSQQFGADCFHCHGGANFSDHQFHNNGLPLNEDLGRFTATGQESDKHLFATPSLRNIALTAPYMHDGSLKTLEDVIDHYNGPLNHSSTLSPHLAKHPKQGLQLKDEDKVALVAFLKTLTDPKYKKK